jgi:ATP-binding cassette, subfamily A (ABC1), member 3
MPGWLVIAGVLPKLVYTYTPAGTVIGFYLISGLALTSSALFGAAFFNRVQLSSLTVSIVSLVLGIIGMATGSRGNAVVGFLSLFFPPINIINFTDEMTYYESAHQTMNLYIGAPGRYSRLPGLLFWECLILQIVAFPVFAAAAERYLYPSASKHRKIIRTKKTTAHPVRLHGHSKYYRYSWFSPLFRRSPVQAVDDLSTHIGSGQITILLGPNGSGKTTTLGCIAGVETPTGGTIEIESAGGMGFCLQKVGRFPSYRSPSR